jgi:hypothetical protein
MANQQVPPQHDDHDIEWTKVTSKNGLPYEIGIKKTDKIEREGETSQLLMAGGSGRIRVHWPVDSYGITTSDVANIGISQWHLMQATVQAPYSFILSFYVTQGWHFSFEDEAGDIYGVTTIFNGGHTLRYNSHKPTIVSVE